MMRRNPFRTPFAIAGAALAVDLALIGSVLTLATGRRTKAAAEVLPRTGREGQAPAKAA